MIQLESICMYNIRAERLQIYKPKEKVFTTLGNENLELQTALADLKSHTATS